MSACVKAADAACMAHLDAACMAHLDAASAVTPPPHCPPGYAVPVNEQGRLKTEECVLDLTCGALSHICNALHVFLLTTAGVGGGEGVSRCEEGGERAGGQEFHSSPTTSGVGGGGRRGSGGGEFDRSRWPRKKIGGQCLSVVR